MKPDRAVSALVLCWLTMPSLGLAATATPIPSSISLAIGEVRSLTVAGITRVAVGDPEVIDVSIVSSSEILLQAKAAGLTNLILWDDQGRQHLSNIEVLDRAPEATEANLRELLGQVNLPGVQVQRQNGALFLVGEVARQEDLDRIEQMLTAFTGVTNLVRLPTTPPAPETGPLVELAVQIVELTRNDLDKLGVKWSDSIPFSEAGLPDQSLKNALFRWGASVTRGALSSDTGSSTSSSTSTGPSVAATLNALIRKNKARLLSEPKLVTMSGKEASSQIGLDVPIITSTSTSSFGATQTTVEFRKTGVLLTMTPTVRTDDPERKITIKMEAELSSIDKSVGLQLVGTLVPGFSVRNTKTEVTAVSGESVVIAGLLESKDSSNVDQVPALGSMPILGRLFRSPELEKTEREIIIVLTPTLLADKGLTADRMLTLERSLAVAEVTASVEDPRLRYALQVQDRILKALRYPIDQSGPKLEGRVTLKLHLLADGSLKQAMVTESSSLESLDLEALEAAHAQSPYPAFPPQLLERELWLELPVIFRPQ